MLSVTATIILPIVLFWFLALLVWRAQELRLMSSAMTEVAVRLAEPDRSAEQSVASLGQAVRKQVNFMNEAVSRALGRAGELEALVHNEVAALERSYQDNEHKIRGLVQELSGERTALVSSTEQMHVTLRSMGNEIPALIEKLSGQQIKLVEDHRRRRPKPDCAGNFAQQGLQQTGIARSATARRICRAC